MRRSVVGAALVIMIGMLGGCGGPANDTGAEGAATGPTLTNSAGESVTLTAPPSRIVMEAQAAAALWDYGLRPAGLIGALARDPVTLGTVDPDDIPVVGGGFDLDLEALAALQPDLIIASQYFCGNTFGRTNEDSGSVAEFSPEINRIAPCLSVTDELGVLPQLGLYQDVARTLGGDVDSANAVADRAAFEAASTEVRDLAARRPEISVIAYSTSGANLFTLRATIPGRAPVSSEDSGFRYLGDDLGVDVTGPASDTEGFVPLSVEQLTAFSSDVAFVNTNARTGVGPTQFPTWPLLPAVAANQTATFDDYRPTTHAAWAAWLVDHVVPALRDARDIA